MLEHEKILLQPLGFNPGDYNVSGNIKTNFPLGKLGSDTFRKIKIIWIKIELTCSEVLQRK